MRGLELPRSKVSASPPEISVSIVIPVRNEIDTIRDLVESLHSQIEPGDELVVVDSGSTDGTLEELETLGEALPRVVVVDAPGSHPGESRNAGILVSENRWVALIDAGTRVDPFWLDSLRSAVQEQYPVDVVFGRFDPVVSTCLDRWALLTYVPRLLPDGTRGPSTASMILNQETWKAAGGFPEFRAGEDRLFFSRLREGRAMTGVAPRAVVQWYLPEGWVRTWRRFSSYSTHNLLAGLWRDWHLGVARNLASVAAFAVFGCLLHPAWLLGIPSLYLARAGWKARGKWAEPSLAGRSCLLLLLGAALLTAFLDAASTWGVLRAPLHSGRE